ncbi:dockerin type I domain-containing protein [Alteromonas lipolytica]|uniref:Peptidase C-terminal archaeal/bacterial domain-containing protein n=1 Tax=Alteromonas lipolytica TaxID=1856405 RepID=A0A1E8FBU2_9ALTE|nr:dockerin type I domain-containing protein [Alteromonas lipolytica]OFI33385.1 hypothetical protein BFC17_03745 [Alteromonas lipolytica]GGF60172.1 hypothetical protein GCM10011338_10530 [Alteromonas lipolytica]
MHNVLSGARHFLLACLLLAIPALAQAEPLKNGGYVEGKIATAGESAIWTFEAKAGDIININVADIDDRDLAPQLVIYAPDGSVLIDYTENDVILVHNVLINIPGTYTVEVKDGHTGNSRGNNQTGNYRIYYLNQKIAEHGELKEKGFVSETIERGDIDSWQFNVTAGEFFSINLTDTDDKDLAVQGTIFNPDGTVLEDSVNNDVQIFHNLQARQTGTYTLIVKDGHTGNSRGHAQTGNYQVFFNKPGNAEHGQLTPNGYVEETITRGDIDSWSFTAQSGELFMLSLVDVANKDLAVHGTIFNPDGSILVDDGRNDVMVYYNVQAKQSGTYTFVVKDGHTGNSRGNAQTGPYRIYLNQQTESEHGPLKNTGMVEETIEFGDLDSWHFDAVEGQTLSLTFTDVAGKDLALSALVYAPDGSTFLEGTDNNVLRFNTVKIKQSGRYYVQLFDGNTGNSRGNGQTGTYQIRMTLIPILKPETKPLVQIEGPASGKLNQEMVLAAKTTNLTESATYSWKLLSSDAAMQNPLILMYKKTAPVVIFTPPALGTHDLEVTVTTANTSYTAKHTITVVNHKPVISLAAKKDENDPNAVLIKATVSDEDKQELTASWGLVGRPADSSAELSRAGELLIRFIPDKSGVYSVTLSVSDSVVKVSERIDITIALDEPAPPAPEPEPTPTPQPEPEPTEPKSCDINNDYFVDKYDIEQIQKALNSNATAASNKLDINNDKTIDAADVAYCEKECTYEGCNSALFQ